VVTLRPHGVGQGIDRRLSLAESTLTVCQRVQGSRITRVLLSRRCQEVQCLGVSLLCREGFPLGEQGRRVGYAVRD